MEEMKPINGRKVDLPSGNKLYVVPAKFEDTEEFLGAFLEAIQGLPSPDKASEEYAKVFSEIVITKAFIQPKLKSSLWKCLAYCVYVKGAAPTKVTPQIFDGIADRKDLAEIFYECAFENFDPFIQGLWNVSKRLQSQIADTQK